MSKLTPKYEELQSIYDISNEFYELFLGPTMGYTCGYFEREDMTGDEAQIAKFDLALGKLGLEPGMTLLDIGCGWGAGMARAIEKYDVNVIGLTLSGEQREYAINKLSKIETDRNVEVRLQGWEEFTDKVDRIVSIGAFEHFGSDRWKPFFDFAFDRLPDDGVMMLHSIMQIPRGQIEERGLPITMRHLRFFKFILEEIFPGGRLPTVPRVEKLAENAGFTVDLVQPLQLHYARTLDLWAAALESRRDEAIAVQSEEVYDRYLRYLTGCADLFRDGYTDVCQFTFTKG